MRRFGEIVFALCQRELLRFLRERTQIYSALARPLLWLVLLGSGMQGAFQDETGTDYMRFLLPGVMTMSILFGGLLSGVSTVWDREFGFMREMLVAPISAFSIVGGKLLAGALVTSLQAFITLAFAPWVGVQLPWIAFALALPYIFLTSIGVVAMALCIAARMRTLEGFGSLANFVALPLFFLSASMYPLRHVPSWMRPLVELNPMTYAVDALRQIVGGQGHWSLAADTAVLTLFALSLSAAAAFLFRRES